MTQNEADLVRKLIDRLGQESFGTGPLAELRRMDPARPAAAPAALHRLLAYHPDDMLRGSGMDRWTLLTHLFALAAPELHRGGDPLGETLFRAGYSEGRLTRLLESEDEALPIVLPRLVRFLTAKRERLRPFELAQLVLWRDTEQDRWRIARDFYRAEAKKPEAV
jgi:CRISPR type I-E-associated protein CasB/Cse2